MGGKKDAAGVGGGGGGGGSRGGSGMEAGQADAGPTKKYSE
jgi:hypothetical protein